MLQFRKAQEKLGRWIGRLTRIVDIDDQVEACRRIFANDTRWTVVRGSDLEEGESKACPCGVGTWVIPSSRAI